MSFEKELENHMVMDSQWGMSKEDREQWENDWTFTCCECEETYHKDNGTFDEEISEWLCEDCNNKQK